MADYARAMDASQFVNVIVLRPTLAITIAFTSAVATAIVMEMNIVIRTILATMMFLLEGCDDLGCHNECILNQR
jgi:hypothetical protein